MIFVLPAFTCATIFGRAPADLTADERQAYGYMPQMPVLFPNLTLLANLNFMASMYGLGMRRRTRLRDLLDTGEPDDDALRQRREHVG
jgi:ABC-2 type transport system ATP-binding protein